MDGVGFFDNYLILGMCEFGHCRRERKVIFSVVRIDLVQKREEACGGWMQALGCCQRRESSFSWLVSGAICSSELRDTVHVLFIQGMKVITSLYFNTNQTYRNDSLINDSRFNSLSILCTNTPRLLFHLRSRRNQQK